MTEPTKLYVPGMGMVPSSSTRRIRALSSRSLQVDDTPKSKPPTATDRDANDEDLLSYNNTTSTTALDLGYGEEHSGSELPTALDLGYGDDTPSAIHIAPPTTTTTRRRRQPRAVGAVQIRNGNRISPMLGPYASRTAGGGSSSCASSVCSYSTDDYDDSSVDYSDDEDDDEDQPDEYEQDLTELTVDMGEDLLLQNEQPYNPHMPSQVNMEFEGDSTSPRRISLAFNQHTQHEDGRSTTRTGCLEVSIGTSRLPRRRANTMDHSHSQNNKDENGEIVRGLKKNHSNLSVSTRPMKRVSMEHTSVVTASATTTTGGRANKVFTATTARITRPVTRRITMNLCSRAPSFSRRLSGISSGGGTEVSDRRLPPNRTFSGYSTGGRGGNAVVRPSSSSFRRAGRRPSSTKNMECYSSPTVPLSSHATRRISMDMSPASPTSRDGGATGGSSRRRISMNLTKSILPREKPDPTITTTPPPKPIRRSTCCHARSA